VINSFITITAARRSPVVRYRAHWNREIKDPTTRRWVTLLAALGLLYAGIDGMFVDERTRSILVDILLIVVGIGLVVDAWRGRRSFALNTN
jgi:hypothetical protein